MRPWDIFRQGAGCLTLIVTFCMGAMFGWVDYWLADTSTPYIDQETAIRYGRDYAEDACMREDHPHAADCAYPRVKIENESKDGWMFTFWSADGKRGRRMSVDRRGKGEG